MTPADDQRIEEEIALAEKRGYDRGWLEAGQKLAEIEMEGVVKMAQIIDEKESQIIALRARVERLERDLGRLESVTDVKRKRWPAPADVEGIDPE